MSDGRRDDGRLASLGLIAAGLADELRGPLVEAHTLLRGLVQELDRHAAAAKGPQPLPYEETIRLRMRLADAFLALGRAYRLGEDLRRVAVPSKEGPEPLDLNALVESALHLVEPRLRAAGDVFVDYAFVSTVRGRGDRLTLALADLFLQVGSVRGDVRVSTRSVRGEVVVAIASRWPGPAEEADLAVVRAVLGEHGGGRLEVLPDESGSTVRITLPAER